MAMELMKQVLKNLQDKYNHVSQIMDLTKDLEKTLNINDEVSAELILDMRETHMAAVDQLDLSTKQTIDKMPEHQKEKFTQILLPIGGTLRLENPLETNIFDTNKRIATLLKKIIVLDNEINKKFK